MLGEWGKRRIAGWVKGESAGSLRVSSECVEDV